jgi:CRISPR-associated protein Csd1
LRSPLSGKDGSEAVEAADFFATALSASGARAVVRDYVETSTDRVKGNIQRWFRLQRLASPDGEEDAYAVRALCSGLTHDLRKELSPSVPQALVRAAVDGGPLPDSLLHLIVRRNRAEQGITRPRAMLTKMVFLSRLPQFDQELIRLDPENRDPAYLCGRLFAELEQAQRAALGKTGTTIRDRYFGAASSTPAVVFGALLRGNNAHLGRLRKEREGAYHAIDARMAQILSRLDGFPPTLDLHGQARFGLGYYHQKAHNIAAAKARKEQGERPTEGEDFNA